VRYPGTRAVTANEIHVPTNTRVDIVGTSADVIHSFWVPELNRKIDLIPGRTGTVLIDADRPGLYRGQCSEFCGVQHAHMAVGVIAESPARFRTWLAGMSSPAPAVFLSEPCASCHTIRGTSAAGTVGPDLTHLASRSTLAALEIPNREAYLRGWIADPQRVKPGAKMPAVPLTARQLSELTAYLDHLH
jgi:cytochrome c oxidase subunit 2